MRRVILIGDSIRIGYQDVVRQQLGGIAEVWSPEESCGDSSNVLKHLEEWVISRLPDVIHINCGLHDLKREFGASETAVPIRLYEENVRHILGRLKSKTSADIIWASTTPVNESLHHRNKEFDRFEADVLSYNRIANQVARDLQVPINDLFSLMDGAGPENYLQDDGVHFTVEGYLLLGKEVADSIKTRLLTQSLRFREA